MSVRWRFFCREHMAYFSCSIGLLFAGFSSLDVKPREQHDRIHFSSLAHVSLSTVTNLKKTSFVRRKKNNKKKTKHIHGSDIRALLC